MQQHSCGAHRRPDDLGDPASQHYPRPFNPRLPYAHGLPIEVDPVPIGRSADGTTGIAFLPSFEASRSGRHVALVALTHGEEICGSHTLHLLLREGRRPTRGRLSFLFNDWRAHERRDPAAPNCPFYLDHDMNRIGQPALLDWPQNGVELARARAPALRRERGCAGRSPLDATALTAH